MVRSRESRGGADAIAADGDALWVANRGEGTVARFDAVTEQVTDRLAVGRAPAGVAIDADGYRWVHERGNRKVAWFRTNEVVEMLDDLAEEAHPLRKQAIEDGGSNGRTLEDLGALRPEPTAQPEAPVHVQKLDAYGRAYATGKRKNAVARVWVKPGSGRITVNEKDYTDYFGRPVLRMIIQQPIMLTERAGQFDILATVSGGGLSGQAGALRHGISKALTYYEPDLRGALKRGGFLTRDSRVVERKKYGRAKARRSFQFSKR